jgi:hypothetical protein
MRYDPIAILVTAMIIGGAIALIISCLLLDRAIVQLCTQ